jgi:hypothetical protein
MARSFLAFIGILMISGLSSAIYFNIRASGYPKYVFINETKDHRFDESIRVSIVAAMERTGVQNAVMITDAVESGTLEADAARLMKELKVGAAQRGRGILYLFSPAKKLLKIEVGYALEGVLPDVSVSAMELAAKSFTYADRYQDFWAELINTLNIEIQERERGSSHEEQFDFANFRYVSGGAGVSSREYEASPEQLLKEFRSAFVTGDFRASADVNEALAGYLKSLHDGAGDSNLSVLAPESRLFRQFTPMTTFQLFRNWSMYTKAGVDRVFDEGKLAFAFFKEGNPVLPIVLSKSDGLWQVNEPLSWSLFQRFEDSNTVFLKYPLAGISKELASYLDTRVRSPLYKMEKPIPLAMLEPNEAKSFDTMALYFKLFWLSRVAKTFAAMDLAKQPVDTVWIAADTFLNSGRMNEFAKAYELAASHFPDDKAIQTNARFYKELIHFKDADWRLTR